MSKYQISWSEKKVTSTGKEKIDATLIDELNVEIPNVTIWADFPNFAGIMTGHTVEGNLVTKQNGQYLNKTLYPIAEAKPITRSAGAITKTMEKKAENIAKAQENKELGIMTSSTIRMAVDIALAETHGLPFDIGVFKSRVKEWRNWLIAEWDNIDNAPPFN